MTDPSKHFKRMKEQMYQEIRELLEKEGPMWDEFQAAVTEHGVDAHLTRETLLAHMIGHRCAIIAAHDKSGAFFMCSPSAVLAAWAGWALDNELETVLSREVAALMGRLGFNPN